MVKCYVIRMACLFLVSQWSFLLLPAQTLSCVSSISSPGCSSCSNNYYADHSCYTTLKTCAQTGPYNCHQYVRSYIANTSYWGQIYQPVPSNNTCSNYSPSQVVSDDAFVRIATKSKAKVVYWSGDHSAVKIGADDYLSKINGNDPLVRHCETAVGLGLASHYFIPVGYLSPGFSGALTGDATVSIGYSSDLCYTWSVTPSNAVQIVSGQGTNSVVIRPLLNATGVSLKVVMSEKVGGSCSSPPYTTDQCLVFNTCTATACTITGTLNGSTLNTYNSTSSYYNSITVSCTNATSFTFTKTSGTVAGQACSNGPCSSFYFYLNPNNSVSYNIKAFNSCGAQLGSRTVAISRGSFLRQAPGDEVVVDMDRPVDKEDGRRELNETPFNHTVAKAAVYPNPVTDLLYVEPTEPEKVAWVVIHDLLGRQLLRANFGTERWVINLNDYRNGIYQLSLLDRQGKPLEQHKIVVLH